MVTPGDKLELNKDWDLPEILDPNTPIIERLKRAKPIEAIRSKTEVIDEPKPVNEPKPKIEILDHDKILELLLSNVKKVDFQSTIYPTANRENPKISNNKYQIVIVNEILKLAKENNHSICQNHQSIFLYNGAYWKKYSNEDFSNFLGLVAIEMGVDKYTAEGYLFKEQLLKQFHASAYLQEPRVDRNKVLINLIGGTFEIEGGVTKIREHKAEDFLTYQLPFAYDRHSTANKFQAYLDKVLPDKERQRVIAEYLGYIFIKHGSNILKAEKVLVLYGSGANGKSVLYEIVRALFGGHNVSSFSLESLTDVNGYYRAQIDTKLLNYASEISNKMDTTRFKAMISGEPIEARHPSGRAMQLEQYAKMIFNCNELPKDTEQTHAFFRRFLIVPFNVIIPEAEQNRNLHNEIIESELSGVFTWVLKGLGRLLRQKGFSECKASNVALDKYKTETDNVKLWIDTDNYSKNDDLPTTLKEGYYQYSIFCSEGGFNKLNKMNFQKRLERLGYKVARGNQNMVYININNR
jgi:putative DNA primase/helicase